MEDPVTFDLWLVGVADRVKAERLLQEAQPHLTRLELLQRLAKGRAGDSIHVVAESGWDDVQHFKREAALIGAAHVYQAGYGPASMARLQRCEAHDLRHAGVLGCPVCARRHRP